MLASHFSMLRASGQKLAGAGLTCLLACRPGLQDHEQKRAHSRRAELAAQARALMKRMRSEVSQGLQYLTAAKQHSGSTNSNADFDPGDPGRSNRPPSKRYD